MTAQEFVRLRKTLDKTQKELALLLGTSSKAVQSYEQGWRGIPASIERQILFLVSRLKGKRTSLKPCWIVKHCPPERRNKCPAWEFRAGKLCWFINGTICQGAPQKDWKEKIEMCRECKVLAALLDEDKEKPGDHTADNG